VISWHQAGLTIAKGPAKRDPANTQWQVDVAVSCAKGLLLSIQERQNDRCQDLRLLMVLKQAADCMPIRIGRVGLTIRCIL
jgi:hypothetical protein